MKLLRITITILSCSLALFAGCKKAAEQAAQKPENTDIKNTTSVKKRRRLPRKSATASPLPQLRCPNLLRVVQRTIRPKRFLRKKARNQLLPKALKLQSLPQVITRIRAC